MLSRAVRITKGALIPVYFAIWWHAYRFIARLSYLTICGYAPSKLRGEGLCDFLSLSDRVPDLLRASARNSLVFFAQNFSTRFPGAETNALQVTHLGGFNPSVHNHEGRVFVSQRVSNYYLNRYQEVRVSGDVIDTRNFLAVLTSTDPLRIDPFKPLVLGEVAGETNHGHHQGPEDARLFSLGSELWCAATVLQFSPTGTGEMMLARIAAQGEGYALEDALVVRTGAVDRIEKNWMPVAKSVGAQLIYSMGPLSIVDAKGHLDTRKTPGLALDHIRGGSQLLPFEDGYLAVVHESSYVGSLRYYLHRFALFDSELNVIALSLAFTFFGKPIEFVGGLAWLPDKKRMVVSLGVNDCQAWLVSFDPATVIKTLRPVPSSL